MPRAFDIRQPLNDHDPLANLLQFSGELDKTAETVGGIIRGYLDNLLQGVVAVIKDLTGLDLSEIAVAIESIDFSSPTTFATTLIQALFEIGDFVITLLADPNFYTGLLEKLATSAGVDLSTPVNFVNSVVSALDNLLGIDLIAMAAGDAQAIIDALLSVFGFGAGTGIPTDLTQMMSDIMGLLGNPAGVGVGATDPLTWATAFINDILTPTGLLGGASSITALVDAILASAGFPPGSGSVPNVQQYFADLETLLSFPTGMAHGTIDPLSWATTFITDILTPTGLIGGASELTNLLAMLGLPTTADLASYLTALPPWAIPVIPASHVRNLNPELLLNPGFDTATSMTTGPTITWDGTTGHTAAGSAKITPQGTSAIDALSNPIGVTAGEKLTVSVWTKWAALSTSGSSPAPIRLDIAQYLSGALVSAVVVASIASPGASGGWTQLTGSYTVPAGVDTIYHRPTVDTTATAGTVWFDDGSMVKAGGLAAGTGLTDAFASTLTALFGSNALAAALLPGIVPILDASKILGGQFATSLIPPLPPTIINGIMAIGQIPTNLLGANNIADLQKTWDAVAGAAAGAGTLGAIGARLTNLTAGGLFNAANLANIANIPALAQTSITGLPAALANLLSLPTWQTFLDTATHGLGGPTSGNTITTYTTALGAIPRTNVVGLPGYLTNLSSGGVLNGPAAVTGLPGYLQNLTTSGILNGPGAVAGLSGYLTNLTSAGLLAASGISGILPIAQIPTGSLGLGNITDLQNVVDGITNVFGGLNQAVTGATQAAANAAMGGIFNSVIGNAANSQHLQSATTGAVNSGTSVHVNFGDYPAGPLPADFTTTYSGTGTSTVVVANNVAHWNVVNNADRTALIRYNAAPTLTDYQLIGSTVATGPSYAYNRGLSAASYLRARCNTADNSYIYAKFTTNGLFGYFCELGCVVAGTKTVWVPATAIPANVSNWLIAGTPAGPRTYQVLSGSTPVISYTETGTVSALSAANRFWGFGGDFKTGTLGAPPSDTLAVSVADNTPPTFVGSSFRAHRGGGNTTLSGLTPVPANFYDTVDRITADMTFNQSTGTLTVTLEGTYLINARHNIASMSANVQADVCVFQNGSFITQISGIFSTISVSPSGVGGGALVYCKPGDTIQIGSALSSGSMTVNGDGGGTATYFEAALVNRNLN